MLRTFCVKPLLHKYGGLLMLVFLARVGSVDAIADHASLSATCCIYGHNNNRENNNNSGLHLVF